MGHSSRVFLVAVLLVTFALIGLAGAMFEIESLLHTAQQRDAFRQVKNQRQFQASADGGGQEEICPKMYCDIPAGNDTCQFMSDNNTVVHICTGFNFCNDSNNYCLAKYPEGHECSSSDQCLSDNIYSQPKCQWNSTLNVTTCQRQKTLGWVGDHCTASSDCWSNNCNTTASVCKGVANGMPCSGTNQCDRDLYCDWGMCSPVHALNDSCSDEDSCGMPWNSVSCIGGRCLVPFAAKEGDYCAVDPESEEPFGACAAGLYCDHTSNICRKFEKIECQNDTSCASLPGTKCACDHVSAKQYCVAVTATAETAGNFTDAFKCGLDIGCALNPDSSKCFVEKCSWLLDCFAVSYIKSMGVPTDCVGFDLKCTGPKESSSSEDHSSSSEGNSSSEKHSSSEDHHSSEEPSSSSDASRTSVAVVITTLSVVVAALL